MAVRAQYPPKVLLLGRTENEMNNEEVNMDFPPNPMLDQSPVFFSNGGNVNWRRRGREMEAMAPAAPSQQQQSVFSLQSPSMLGLAQFQPRMPSLVFTGLRLALEEQKHSQIKKEQPDSFLSDHPWMREDGEASDKPIDSAVQNRMKQFRAMNKLKKLVVKFIAENLFEEEIKGLKQMFKNLDTDRSGMITYDEL